MIESCPSEPGRTGDEDRRPGPSESEMSSSLSTGLEGTLAGRPDLPKEASLSPKVRLCNKWAFGAWTFLIYLVFFLARKLAYFLNRTE